MSEMKEKTSSNVGEPARSPAESKPPSKVDPTAPAGSENSLGAEGAAMDEESPDITGTSDTAVPDDID